MKFYSPGSGTFQTEAGYQLWYNCLMIFAWINYFTVALRNSTVVFAEEQTSPRIFCSGTVLPVNLNHRLIGHGESEHLSRDNFRSFNREIGLKNRPIIQRNGTYESRLLMKVILFYFPGVTRSPDSGNTIR